MSTTNYPKARPALNNEGKPVMFVTHADYVIDGVNRNNPHFIGSIFLNGIKVLSTQTGEGGEPEITPFPPEMGGTGFDNLQDLANEIAKLLGFTVTGEGSSANVVVPITKGGTGKTTAAAALAALGGASAAWYSVNIPVSWSTNSSGGYTQTVTVSGIKSSDVPVVGVVLSEDTASAKLQGAAFAKVNRITTADNQIKLYCYNTSPTTTFTLQLLVVRGF